MKKILLTSAGTEIAEEILKILPKPASELKLAHIITASNVEEDKTYLDRDFKKLSELGFNVENIDIANKSEGEIRKILSNKDVIYVQGGNTFYLLKHVRESGFDKVAKELVEKGVMYVGVSAGSIIVGPSIESAMWLQDWDKNDVGIKNLDGLGWVDFAIVPHYEEGECSEIKKKAKEANYPILLLKDSEGVLINGDNKVVVGGSGEWINKGY